MSAPTSDGPSPTASSFEIAELLRRNAYPHAVDNLELRETHISWVILTGSLVYKIKKPVKLNFIDASTLGRRQQLCEEEIRLNRRLAPELYLDVVPIVRQGPSLIVGGQGAPIEYAVRMKQFPHDQELLSLLANDGVAIDEVAELAERLANFHRAAAVATWHGAEQQAQRVRAAVMGNLVHLVSSEQAFEAAPALGRLVDWTHDAANALEDTLCSRARCIRECHGDLHAGNVVRHAGRLTAFDCIEFNRELRYIDVIDDVSFLFMDLISHGRADLAYVLLSRYLEVGGDYAGTRLLRFYAVYRALVRATVDALTADQVPSRSPEFRERLRRRVNAALKLTHPEVPPLVLMHGLSGSGKSWLSERLVAALPAVRVRSDLERKRLAAAPTTDASGESDIYSPAFNHRTYARLLECAESCLASGLSVIVDATFLDGADRELFHTLAKRMRVPRVIVSCEADTATLSARLAERNRTRQDASDANVAVMQAQHGRCEPFTREEQALVVTVDTRAEDAVAHVAAAIHELCG